MAKAKEALILEPSEIHFSGPYDEVKTSHFLMNNTTERYIIFKVKSTVPQMYYIEPNAGYIKPKRTLTVAVMLQPFSPLRADQSRNNLIIQSIYSPWKGEPFVEWLDDLWQNTPPNKVMNSKLQFTFHQTSSTTQTQNTKALKIPIDIGRSVIEKASAPVTLPDEMVETKQYLSPQSVAMNVASAQVITLTSETITNIDQSLILEPSELHFSGPYNEGKTSYFSMTNPNSMYIIFKVETTAPQMYCVKPNVGFIKPKQKLLVTVMLHPFAPLRSNQNRNRLRVLSKYSPWKGKPYADWLEDLWQDFPPNEAMNSKLQFTLGRPSSTTQWQYTPPNKVMDSSKLQFTFDRTASTTQTQNAKPLKIPIDIGRSVIENTSVPVNLPDLGTHGMVKTKQYPSPQSVAMNVASPQVITLTSETMTNIDQVLILEPSELHFSGPYNEGKTSYFSMTNPNSMNIIFKVETTAPQMYSVKPNVGYIKPKQKQLVTVMLHPFAPLRSNQSRNRLLVRSRYSPWKGEPYADWVEDLWQDFPPNEVMNSKLQFTLGRPSSTTQTQNSEVLNIPINVGRSVIENAKYSVPVTLPDVGTDEMIETKQYLSPQLVAMNVAIAQIISLTSVLAREIDHLAVTAAITRISTNLSDILQIMNVMAALVEDLQGEYLLDASRNLFSAVTNFLKTAEPVTKENRLDAAGGVENANLINSGEEDQIKIEVQGILEGRAKHVGNAIAHFTPTVQNVALQCDDLMRKNLVVAKSIECALIASAFVSCFKDVTLIISSPICQQQIIEAAKKLSSTVEDTKKACYDATGDEVLLNDVRQASSQIEDLLLDFVSHIRTTSDQGAQILTHDGAMETATTTDVTPTLSNPICKQLIEDAIKVSKVLEGIRKACNALPGREILPNLNLNPIELELVLRASEIFPESLVQKFVVQTLKDSTEHFTTLQEVIDAILNYNGKEPNMNVKPANGNTGTSSSIESAAEVKDVKEINLCKICMELQMSVAFQPCGHVASCQECAELINNCPVCRARIKNIIRIYLS